MIKRLFILPIRFYQLFISPIIGGNRSCRFMPTCSSYAIEAIEKCGIFKGLLMAMIRILRCNPWGKTGYHPVNCGDLFCQKKKKVIKNIGVFIILIVSGILNQKSFAQSFPDTESLGVAETKPLKSSNASQQKIDQPKEKSLDNKEINKIKEQNTILDIKEIKAVENKELIKAQKEVEKNKIRQNLLKQDKIRTLKKLKELKRDYLQNGNPRKVEGIRNKVIMPKAKVLPKFTNNEIPAPLLSHFRSEDNRHNPIIISNKDKIGLMFTTISQNKINDFNSLLGEIKDPNIKNGAGDTLLTFAVLMSRYDAISSLLSKGANPDLPNNLGYTPLNIAIEMMDYKAALILVSNGFANVNLVDADKSTYLMQAVKVGSLKITDLLIKNGAAINNIDDKGQTALSLAYQYNREVIAKYLSANGAKKL